MSDSRYVSPRRLEFIRALLASPERAGGAIAFAVLCGVLAALATRNVSSTSFVVLLVGVALLVFQVGVHLLMIKRFPRWLLHVDFVADVLLGSLICVLEPQVVTQFGFFYLWAIFFAALYFSKKVFVAYYLFVASAYACVALVTTSSRSVIDMGAPILVTGAVLGLITVNLVTLLRESSEVDALTKLANRRAWEQRSEEEFERAKRSGGSLSMVIIDVDDFKEVNDRDGHSAGDHLLRALADGWSREIRGGGDFLARIGGDEFAYLAPGADLERINLVIERLRQSMPEGVSCSFGASSWHGISDLADLARSADEAMYRAKRERKVDGHEIAASAD
ncbi:MAG: GGDEF domain-containing protein [Acidimicrobiales bacterium]